jgi:hypothetical protein
MLLRFIGENQSMNLVRGQCYEVDIRSDYKSIYVKWFNEKGQVVCCPYSSPALFACNWMKPSDINETWRKY